MAYDQFDIDQTPVLQLNSSEKNVPMLHITVSYNKNPEDILGDAQYCRRVNEDRLKRSDEVVDRRLVIDSRLPSNPVYIRRNRDKHQ